MPRSSGGEFRKPNVVVLVAERDGELLGYAYAGIEGPDYMALRGHMALRGPAGVLYDLVIDAAQRGRGSGGRWSR